MNELLNDLTNKKFDKFHVPVIATMSSGKSTFINALVGQDILPSKNQACTARILPIKNIDGAEEFTGYITYKDGTSKKMTLTNEDIQQLNENPTLRDILIEGNIQGLKNSNKNIVLYDTPGTNFSGDTTHQETTYKFVSKFKSGLIVYLINGTQFGINDDRELLQFIINKVNKSNGKIDIVFVVNKIDEFDIEKEDVEVTMNDVKRYLIDNGVINPKIIAISALAAKIFRKALNGEQLSRRELREFYNYYELFEPKGYCLPQYAIMSNTDNVKKITVGSKKFDRATLVQALNNTGITLIENILNYYAK